MNAPDIDIEVKRSWYQCNTCYYVDYKRSNICPSCGLMITMREIEETLAMKFRSAGGYGKRRLVVQAGQPGANINGVPFRIADAPMPQIAEQSLYSENENESGQDEEEDEEEDDEDESEEEQKQRAPKPPPRVEVKQVYRVKGGIGKRYITNIETLDHVLDGGIPLNTCLVTSAAPGCGKSTLYRQAAASLAQQGLKVMYASGEETDKKAKREFKRLGLFKKYPKAKTDRLVIVCTNNPDSIIAAAKENEVDVLFVDSFSVMVSLNTSGDAGQEKQMKYAAYHFSQAAHADNEYKGTRPMTIMGIVHMTKAGDMAGTNAAKHWVDGAFKMEHVDGSTGELVEDQTQSTGYVMLRVNGKYREGDATAKGYFEMTKQGLVTYKLPSPSSKTTTTSRTAATSKTTPAVAARAAKKTGAKRSKR